MASAVKNYRRTYRMGLDDTEITEASRDCDTYAEFVSQLFDLLGKKNGKPLSGEKTPDYCGQMPVLHALFPTARFMIWDRLLRPLRSAGELVRRGVNRAVSTASYR